MQLLADVTAYGGACTRKHLYALGYTKRQLQQAVASGEVIAASRSWLAVPKAPEYIRVALGIQGYVGGATALVSYGVWVTVHDQIHVAVRPGRSYKEPADAQLVECAFDTDPMAPWRVSVVDALVQYIRRATRNDAVAAVDSALNRRLISPMDLPRIAQRLPRRCRPWLKRVNGKAESGIESILRLACEDEGWDVQVQVPYRGGRVDLVINGWLYVEVDGSKYHDVAAQAAKDRARNNALAADGYRWHRFGYADIVHSLESSIRTLRRLLHQGNPTAAV